MTQAICDNISKEVGEQLDLAKVLYCDTTVGALVRKLNAICFDAVRDNCQQTAENAARLSSVVEEAVEFAGMI